MNGESRSRAYRVSEPRGCREQREETGSLAGSAFLVQIRCPQCGGDFDFSDQAHVIRCQYCGSLLCIGGREGLVRYVLDPCFGGVRQVGILAANHLKKSGRRSPAIDTTLLVYVPFWRMQGSVYRWIFGFKRAPPDIEEGRSEPIEHTKLLLTRVLDHTIPAYTSFDTGLMTLGVRAQAVRLKPFGHEGCADRDFFLPLRVSQEQAGTEAERHSQMFLDPEEVVPEMVIHRVVGVTLSVIYMPVWYVECRHEGGRDRLFIDSVAGSVLRSFTEDPSFLAEIEKGQPESTIRYSRISLLPFRCPNCGWPFPFRPMNILHFCSTCRRLWRHSLGEWEEVGYHAAATPGERSPETLLWIPFWRCRATIESGGVLGATMADFIRCAPQLGGAAKGKQTEKPMYFYVPGIRFRNPHAFHTLASRATCAQPDSNVGAFPEGCTPVTAGVSLSAKDVCGMGTVIMGSFIQPANRRFRQWVEEMDVKLTHPEIVYFPFVQEDLFWKWLSTGISFQRSALHHDVAGGSQ